MIGDRRPPPRAFIISKNLHRRHLDESQRAMAAARIGTLKVGDNQHSEGVPIGTASEKLNVSERTVKRARVVLDNAEPEVGDWWAFGGHHYGERARAAAEGLFGRSFGDLANIGSVARSFENFTPP